MGPVFGTPVRTVEEEVFRVPKEGYWWEDDGVGEVEVTATDEVRE